ncbi:hypothetical protein CONPUDRAFT_151187 [Coniophora puteana RWD-64-598 SS2]|uniref:DUF6532 domain-containing protein n=1 Tax=Coniophora puteana (strain RWD-64-598) TaxID=741705 RepID=A0A5M3MY95_CONPW|nr:uncharacterized protein CONPUDRAFT_151187 [Coniophora puteana RWD-64-598 SS2]EIW84143.1 hypothetical protein CONPUDRAFT_151187 [Coniophora puteana RWD-64-598 SS2]
MPICSHPSHSSLSSRSPPASTPVRSMGRDCRQSEKRTTTRLLSKSTPKKSVLQLYARNESVASSKLSRPPSIALSDMMVVPTARLATVEQSMLINTAFTATRVETMAGNSRQSMAPPLLVPHAATSVVPPPARQDSPAPWGRSDVDEAINTNLSHHPDDNDGDDPNRDGNPTDMDTDTLDTNTNTNTNTDMDMDTDEDDGGPDSDTEAPAPSRRTGDRVRPKLGNYSGPQRRVIVTTQEFVCALAFTTNAFPDNFQLESLPVHALARVNNALSQSLAMTPEIHWLISQNVGHLRGEIKTKARHIVALVFKFESSPGPEGRERNRELASQLKEETSWIYRDWVSRRFIYSSPAIQMLINEVFFQGRNDDSIQRADFYKPFPKVALALIMAAIDCAIDEWHTGKRTTVHFTEPAYCPIYETFLNDLNRFEQEGMQYNIMEKLQCRIYRDGLEYSGVEQQAVAAVSMTNTAISCGVVELNDDFD